MPVDARQTTSVPVPLMSPRCRSVALDNRPAPGDVGHEMSSELTNGTPSVLRLADGKKIWVKPWRLKTKTT
jgi:hypothetical protein